MASTPSSSSSTNAGAGTGGAVPTVAQLALAAAAAALGGCAAGASAYHLLAVRRRRRRGNEKSNDDEKDGASAATATIRHLTELRSAERRGRIRAEIRLRDALKGGERRGIRDRDGGAGGDGGDGHTAGNNDAAMMPLRCIGTMRTPFPKRMGTPRQGALVPHSRGYLQLHPRICPPECLHGMDSYSHAWIIFGFHANTDLPGGGSNSNSNHRKTKIRPPRAPRGVRVGQLATRSPHRPNPVGLSLVRIVGFDSRLKRLHVSALDLVDGTPVYDVKPCVPWDVPGQYCDSTSADDGAGEVGASLRVPSWVSSREDAVDLDDVKFETGAECELRRLVVDRGKLAPLYSGVGGFEVAALAIREVLAQDPRASHRRGSVTTPATKEKRAAAGGGEGISEDGEDDPYRFVFGRVQVEFVVRKRRPRSDENGDDGGGDDHIAVGPSSSRNGNGNVVVVVTGVTGVDFDSGGGAETVAAAGVPLAEDIIADEG